MGINLKADFMSIFMRKEPWPSCLTRLVITSSYVYWTEESYFAIPEFIELLIVNARYKINLYSSFAFETSPIGETIRLGIGVC